MDNFDDFDISQAIKNNLGHNKYDYVRYNSHDEIKAEYKIGADDKEGW